MLEGSNCYWYCWYITCLYVSEKKIRGDSYCRAKQRPSASSHYVNPHCVGPHLQAHFWGRRPSWGALHKAPSGHPPTDVLKLLAINNGIQYIMTTDDNFEMACDGDKEDLALAISKYSEQDREGIGSLIWVYLHLQRDWVLIPRKSFTRPVSEPTIHHIPARPDPPLRVGD